MGDVVAHVEEVGAQADHPGLVADVLHSVEDVPDGVRITHVALDEVDLVRQVGGGLGMRGERVEHAYGPAFGEQRVDDVRADEACASGDEDHAGGPAVRTRVISRVARKVPRMVPVTFDSPIRGR